MDILRFEIPWPPSINHYYIHTASRVILSASGKRYRRDVALLLSSLRGSCGAEARLSLVINAFPPDKRKRDLDNIIKAVQDALQHAGVYADDFQIDMLTVIRREPVPQGSLSIWISECS